MPKDRVIRSMTEQEYDVTGLSKAAATSVLQRTLAKYLDLPKTNIKIMSGRSGWKAIIKPRGDKSGEKSVEISSENGNFLDFIKRNLTNAQATKLTEEMDMG